jgi:hypothetical protein
MPKIEGSCLCESIKYSCATDAVFTVICHCSSCQKLTGSAFTVVIGINKGDFKLSGNCLTKYEFTGDSGKPVTRCFCKKCGSLIYGEMEVSPNIVSITAGTLRDHSWVKPQMHVYWRDHFQCLSEIDAIPKFEIMPSSK